MVLIEVVVDFDAELIALIPRCRVAGWHGVVGGEAARQWNVILLVKVNNLLRNGADPVGGDNVSGEYVAGRRINDCAFVYSLSSAIRTKRRVGIEQRAEVAVQECGGWNRRTESTQTDVS